MFEKLPVSRMTSTENSATERLIAAARDFGDKHMPCDGLRHFASYLRLFDIFFGLLVSDSCWEAARLLVSGCRRFRTAEANVAFL
jgi:hypothetical protein